MVSTLSKFQKLTKNRLDSILNFNRNLKICLWLILTNNQTLTTNRLIDFEFFAEFEDLLMVNLAKNSKTD